MTLSIWRYSHLLLAIFSFLFVLMASITGAILSFDPINEKAFPYKAEQFDQITLSQTIPVLKDKYSEILELSVDHNQFVTLEGFDEQGNDFKHIIHPNTGEILGNPIQKSEFIQWVTSLHRSLFLHETGRFIVGFVSFLLLLITISGTVLIVKRQQGVRNFFTKIKKDYFAQYYHVAVGRLLLLPILIISLTGTYLFLLRFEIIPNPKTEFVEVKATASDDATILNPKEFTAFQSLYLKDIVKVEFPFDEDPAEFYKVKTKQEELTIDQYSGEIVAQVLYPKAKVFETLSLDLHTGRTNSFWAIVLALASINIIFFIWSGFVITFKRTKTKVAKNKIKAEDAEIIILVGSENGTTLGFANKIHEQLLAIGKKSHLTQMNNYQTFAHAKQLFIFTSTYGIGEAPTNAKKFENLVEKHAQNTNLQFAIVGFGSRAYSQFCGYAIKTQQFLTDKLGYTSNIPLKLINDRSPEDFALWVKEVNQVLDLNLAITPAQYVGKKPKLKEIKVVNTTKIPANDTTFTVTLKTNKKFQSGDLLAIYPANDHRERLYSIGKVNNQMQLVVKLHDQGLGSNYLYQLQASSTILARIVKNKAFHLPKKATEIIMIANGTGIAPFLGMISENNSNKKISLYTGFRFNNQTTISYNKFANEQMQKGKLSSFQIAFSRENNKQYVMGLIENDAEKVAKALNNGAVIMICGSLTMQNDVEKVLQKICSTHSDFSFETFKNKGQFLTDCY